MLSLTHPYLLAFTFTVHAEGFLLQTSATFTWGLSLNPGVSRPEMPKHCYLWEQPSGNSVVSWRSNTPASPNCRCSCGSGVTLSSKSTQEDWATDAHMVTCWILNLASDSFPSLTHGPLPSSVCWVTSNLNYMHLNPCFRACFWGNSN